MSSPNFSYSDEIIKKALPEINKYFEDVTVEQIKSFGFLPYEIITALEKQQAIFNLKNKIYPVSVTTDSKDGKTCDWCKKDLIVKTSKTSTSAGVTEKTVLICPNGGVKCKIDVKKKQSHKLFEESQEQMKNETDIHTIKTRNMKLSDAQKIFKINMEDPSIKVSAPNSQLTEINFAKIVCFRQEPVKNEAKKLLTFSLCEHDLDNYLNMETGELYTTKNTSSKHYRLITVKKIGKLGIIGCRCVRCENIRDRLVFRNEDPELAQKLQNELDNILNYEVEVQRIDSEIEKDIIQIMRADRLNARSGFFKSAQIHEAVLKEHEFCWIVNRSDKQFFSSRCKKLANKGIFELEQKDWTFGYHIEGTFHKYNMYGTETLNHCRWFNPHAIFLTSAMRLKMDEITEKTSGWTTEEDKKERKELFAKIASQFGLNGNEITIGKRDRQVNLKCSLKNRPTEAKQ